MESTKRRGGGGGGVQRPPGKDRVLVQPQEKHEADEDCAQVEHIDLEQI